MSLRQTAWILNVSASILSDWNQCFDEHLRPLKIPDQRGKTSKITVELVRQVVGEANRLKQQGNQLKLRPFSKQLKKEHGIVLSRRKLREILIANNLFEARVQKRRPKFYQSLRKRIPNGLVSLDGSELTVLLDQTPYKFNVELCVDVTSFNHTAFSVGDSENSDEIITVLEAHEVNWGSPLGILCDHGSGNLSEKNGRYLKEHDIEMVAVGPSNPKGNGTDEGAFSQMKQALGTICLDCSSAKALARTVLEKLVSLYVFMRNRIASKNNPLTPQQTMETSVSQREKDIERQRLKAHNRKKLEPEEDQKKKEHLFFLLRYHGIFPDADVLKRAERTIKAFELKAIEAAEQAFVKAVRKNPQKATLPYFFGILKNIQQERDNDACKAYCYERYNEQVMLNLKQEHEQMKQPDYSIENIIGILIPAMHAKIPVVKELSIQKARQWTRQLLKSYRYPGALKKRFSDALGAFNELTIDLKNRIWELIEQFLEHKPETESVTHFS